VIEGLRQHAATAAASRLLLDGPRDSGLDQLFGIIAACAAEPGQSAFTENDEALGFPTTVSCLRPDDEALWGFTPVRTYNVTDLRALP
jgi:hypothetical protein